MFGRKCLAAYFASWAMVLWLSFPYLSLGGGAPQAAEHYLSWAGVIALYAVPVIFVYGIIVSVLLELAARKLKAAGPGEWIVSGLLHTAMGFAFGFVVQSSMFAIMGGLAAVLFFVFDRFVPWFLQFGRKRTRAAVLAAPLLLFGLLAGAVYAASPPLPPFTAADAAAFATSGSGTLIDLFPKQEGEVRKLQIEGYDVERETAVTPMKGKERYQVDFIERWSKGAESGEHRMSYEVTRGSMGAHGGGGAEPPYRR